MKKKDNVRSGRGSNQRPSAYKSDGNELDGPQMSPTVDKNSYRDKVTGN
jgi:hypothetical protein